MSLKCGKRQQLVDSGNKASQQTNLYYLAKIARKRSKNTRVEVFCLVDILVG